MEQNTLDITGKFTIYFDHHEVLPRTLLSNLCPEQTSHIQQSITVVPFIMYKLMATCLLKIITNNVRHAIVVLKQISGIIMIFEVHLITQQKHSEQPI